MKTIYKLLTIYMNIPRLCTVCLVRAQKWQSYCTRCGYDLVDLHMPPIAGGSGKVDESAQESQTVTKPNVLLRLFRAIRGALFPAGKASDPLEQSLERIDKALAELRKNIEIGLIPKDKLPGICSSLFMKIDDLGSEALADVVSEVKELQTSKVQDCNKIEHQVELILTQVLSEDRLKWTRMGDVAKKEFLSLPTISINGGYI